jgi:hypothetical protein
MPFVGPGAGRPAQLRSLHSLPPPCSSRARRLHRPLRHPQPKSLQTKNRRRHPHSTLESLPHPPAGPHLPTPRRRPRLHQQPFTPHPPRHRQTRIVRRLRHRYDRRSPPYPQSATSIPAIDLPNSKLLLTIHAKTLRLPPHNLDRRNLHRRTRLLAPPPRAILLTSSRNSCPSERPSSQPR